MNEPRVVESVTNECQLLGRAHESSSARAEQLIACLEGEIAKRDEVIVGLTNSRDFWREKAIAADDEWAKDANEWGGALNYAAWEFVNECPEKSALLFNNTKGPLRAAIMKYAEIVAANRAKGVV